MADLLTTAKFPSASGDVDEQENRWAFHSDVPGAWTSAQLDAITSWLDDFYANFSGYLFSNELANAVPASYDHYNITGHLDGSPHGAPIRIDAGRALSTSDVGLPGQIAVCVDYHADLTGVSEFGTHARPRARHRGRHYHGPVIVSSLDHDPTTNIPKWANILVTHVQSAYSAALADVPSGIEWCVWSRKDAALYPVIGGWVDTTPRRARRREEPTNVKAFWS